MGYRAATPAAVDAVGAAMGSACLECSSPCDDNLQGARHSASIETHSNMQITQLPGCTLTQSLTRTWPLCLSDQIRSEGQ